MAFGKYLFISAVLAQSVYAADVPVESRPLSSMPVTLATANANLNWDLLQKNQQLESELRELRGKIEVLENSIDKLNADLLNRYTDLDQRIELLKQQVDPTEETTPADTPVSPTSPSPSTGSNENTANASPLNLNTTTSNNSNPAVLPNVAVNTSVLSNTAATPVNNTLGSASNVQQQIVATSQGPAVVTETNKRPTLSDSNVSTNSAVPLSQSERNAYTKALETYKNNGAALAIAPMQQFIRNYPNSVYLGNAHFWLAEFNLAANPVNYTEAKKNYGVVIRQYPQSAKASRALFQLYNISLDVDKNKMLADKFKSQLLKYYPTTEEAKFFANQK